jgi:hypothetical protein
VINSGLEYESPNGAEPAGWIGVSESPRQLEPDFNDVPISRDDTLRTGRDTNPVILEPIDRIRSHLHEDDRGSDNKGLKRLAQSKISLVAARYQETLLSDGHCMPYCTVQTARILL